MKKITLSAMAILSLASVGTTALSADEGFSLLSNAKFNGEVRPRYENVTVEDSTKKDADAFTVRATIGLEANLLGVDGLSMKVDGTTVQTLGATRYDNNPSAALGDSGYEVVADPEHTRLTQGYLQYKLGKTAAKVGRQIVNLDNQRFIGSVDWRQMMQSVDAAVISDSTVDNLTLVGAYVWGIKGITNIPTVDTNSIILNGSYKINDMFKVTAYDYMLSSVHDTIGLALTGDIPAAGAKINYRAEYASQGDASQDTANGAKDVQANAHYYNLDALANISGIIVGAGYEVLSGTSGTDGKTAFSTPLATLHKFNGWADKFLATPTGGLCDASVTLGYGAAGLGKATVTYHDFKTDKTMSGNSDLGSEWDVMYTNDIPGIKGLNALAKAAYFQGGDIATYNKDVSKLWLQLDYKF